MCIVYSHNKDYDHDSPLRNESRKEFYKDEFKYNKDMWLSVLNFVRGSILAMTPPRDPRERERQAPTCMARHLFFQRGYR